MDSDIAVRLIVGMAFSVTVHRDWLFADDQPQDFDYLVDQLTMMTLWGLEGPTARLAATQTACERSNLDLVDLWLGI